MDKDRFRQDLGKVEEAYQEVARRLGIMAFDAQEHDEPVLASGAPPKPSNGKTP